MATTNEKSPVEAESDNDVSDVETEASDVDPESEVEEASPSDVSPSDDESEVDAEEEAIEEVEAEASEAGESESEVESGVEGEEDEAAAIVKKKKTGKKKAATAKGKRTTKVITDITALSASGHGPVYEEDDDDDDDEDEADDELYLQKFDKDLRDNYILNFHPEARAHNYEEVKASTKVTRDARGIIIDPLHKTLPFLTKYEMTRIIGQRAKQLDSGAKAFVKVPPNIIDGYHIAQLEIEQKKIPFIIKRPLPNGGIEYWNVNDLEIL
jgi:DNA-directed RNA polymerase subunit K/omega